MKKKIFIISLIALAGVLIIFANIWINLSSKNGFNRKLTNLNVVLDKRIGLDNIQSYTYFAYTTNDAIWLQNRKTPFTLINVDYSLRNQKEITLSPPSQFNSTRRNYYFDQVKSSTLITNEVGELVKLEAEKAKFFKIPNLKFDSPIFAAENTVFARNLVYNNKRGMEIIKISIKDSAKIQQSYSLPKQIDGFFCTDGRLEYDKKNARLYYMYYYRGAFLCLDTNLNLLYNAKTVDTVNFAKLNFGHSIKQKDPKLKVTNKSLKSSSQLVNKFIAINDNKVYIVSNIMANNQAATDFLTNSTIDVYSATDGSYLYSFEFPKYHGNHLGEFVARGKNIFALYQGALIKYNLKE